MTTARKPSPYGWRMFSTVTGGYWGHWRTREDAEADNCHGRFVAQFNHRAALVFTADWD